MVTQTLLDQEPDAIALIPDFSDFFVIGTYSLVSNDGNGDSGSAARRGSLQILPFARSNATAFIVLDRKDFDFGVYDIKFHPRFRNLLGVATSDGSILIYSIQSTVNQFGDLERLHLQEIGKAAAEEDDGSEAASVIVTQIQFVDEATITNPVVSPAARHHHLDILIMITTQSGNTTMLNVRVATTGNSLDDAKIDAQYTQLRVVHTQSYGLEAWTVLLLPLNAASDLKSSQSASRSILAISGGDDSQLLISQLDFENSPLLSCSGENSTVMDFDEVSLTRLATERRSHAAGIVSTCHLVLGIPELEHQFRHSQMFLTGSYDEKIRLFQLKLSETDHGRCELNMLSEFTMPSGVWRILLLDCYRNMGSVDCVFLIAGHTAGALVVRLTLSPLHDSFAEALESWHYSWKIETHFTQHQSLVYAVAARRKTIDGSMWQLISTSFYDKLICEWEWEDREWRPRYPTV